MNVIGNKYEIQKYIGCGNFSNVYLGKKIHTNDSVAIKMENSETSSLLKHEAFILHHLFSKGCRNIPFVYWYGKCEIYNCLVMNYYPFSLSSMDKKTMFSMVDIFKHIHSHKIVHRDVKPQNFMMDDRMKIHLIDFGFATFHQEEQPNRREFILGTPKYISCNVHLGMEPSWRDDLISLGYVYFFFANCSLPWENICGVSKDELHIQHPSNQIRLKMKKWEIFQRHCFQMDDNFSRYMDYCCHLEYHTIPNYNELMQLFT